MRRPFDGVNLTRSFARAISDAMSADLSRLADSYVGEWVRCNRFDAIESRPFTSEQVERWLREGRRVTTPEGIGPALAFSASGTILVDE